MLTYGFVAASSASRASGGPDGIEAVGRVPPACPRRARASTRRHTMHRSAWVGVAQRVRVGPSQVWGRLPRSVGKRRCSRWAVVAFGVMPGG